MSPAVVTFGILVAFSNGKLSENALRTCLFIRPIRCALSLITSSPPALSQCDKYGCNILILTVVDKALLIY